MFICARVTIRNIYMLILLVTPTKRWIKVQIIGTRDQTMITVNVYYDRGVVICIIPAFE